MVRLIVAALIALVVGYGLGWLQFTTGYGQADERFADLSIYEAELGKDLKDSASVAPSRSASQPRKADSSAEDAPKLQILGGTSHDFGTMQQGGTKQHTFTFKNIGTAPMELKVSGSSCRCTIGSLKDSVLDPGEETGVTLEWKATGVLDKFSQTATISTSDPDHRNVLLTVSGIVTRTILIEPSTLNFGDVPVGHGAKQSAFVFGYGGEPLEVKKVVWADERTQKDVEIVVEPVEVDLAKFPQHANAKGVARIDVSLKSGIALGPIASRLILDTNLPNVSDIDLGVSGTVVGDIQFLPNPSFEPEKNILEFERVPSGAGTTRKLFLSVQGEYRDTLKLEVDEIVPAESLQVVVGEPTRQQTRTIIPLTFTVPKGAPPAMFPGTSGKNFGKVILKTNHPDIPQLRVNLRIIVE